MFDSRDIAQRALQRATELKEERKRKLSMIQSGALLSALTAVVVSAAIMSNPVEGLQTTNFESTPVPLAATPIKNLDECTECEIEPDEECEICEE